MRNHEIILNAINVFNNWPENYFIFLRGLRYRDNKVRSDVGLFRDFGRFKPLLFKYFTNTNASFLVEEFCRYLTDKYDGGYITKDIMDNSNMSSKRRLISSKAAAERLGIVSRAIHDLIKCGSLQGTIRTMGKKTLCLVNAESVEKLRLELESSIGTMEVANRIGIGHQFVPELVKNGCIDIIRGKEKDGFKNRRYNPSAIDKFMNEIGRRVSKRKFNGTTVNLYNAIKMLTMIELGKTPVFIKAIIYHKVSPCAWVEKKGLNGLLFKRMDLEVLLKTYMRKEFVGMNIIEAAKRLNTSAEAVRYFLEKGFLVAEEQALGKLHVLSLKDHTLTTFRKNHVFASDLAKKLGVSTRKFVDRIVKKGIQPISGPIIDGGPKYIFRRVDVPYRNYRIQKRPSKLLTTRQSAEYLEIKMQKFQRYIYEGKISRHKGKGSEVTKQLRFSRYELDRFRDSILHKSPLVPAS